MNTKLMNQALMIKWIWQMLSGENENLLWLKLLRAKYRCNSFFFLQPYGWISFLAQSAQTQAPLQAGSKVHPWPWLSGVLLDISLGGRGPYQHLLPNTLWQVPGSNSASGASGSSESYWGLAYWIQKKLWTWGGGAMALARRDPKISELWPWAR
jgi:hypothetical protein